MAADMETIVGDIVATIGSADDRGSVASYIPELAKVDPGQFGIAIATADGDMITGGDCGVGFSIQSISKVFALTLALGKVGDQLWERVGGSPPARPSTPSFS